MYFIKFKNQNSGLTGSSLPQHFPKQISSKKKKKKKVYQETMLHDANLVAKSGKGEADEVGFSHMVKDAEYHTKETEGNVGLSRVIT